MKFVGKNSYFIAFLLVVCAAIFLRLYSIEERVTFGSEQARSLYVAGKYITEKPSLLGQEYFRVTSQGHKLFSGALFSYTLVPLQLLFDFDPLPITYYFALLNVFTGVLLFFLSRRLFGEKIALFTCILFLFNGYMVYHSMFIWILNYLPLIGLSLFYATYLFYKKPRLKYVALIGLFSGIGINFHYLVIPLAAVLFLYVLYKSARRFKSLFLFLGGLFLGNITIFAFDLRHGFYHSRTLIQYGLDTLRNPGQSAFSYYHFLHFWPVLALLGGYLLYRIWRVSKPASSLIVILYILANLMSSEVSFERPTGMPEGLFYNDVIEASRVISEDVEGNFNVVSLLDFDKRGYILRYPLEFMFDKKPMGVEEYPFIPRLYALAQEGYNFNTDEVWELRVAKPYEVHLIDKVGDGYGVYRLDSMNQLGF